MMNNPHFEPKLPPDLVKRVKELSSKTCMSLVMEDGDVERILARLVLQPKYLEEFMKICLALSDIVQHLKPKQEMLFATSVLAAEFVAAQIVKREIQNSENNLN
jgi:hypothetical protein